MPPSTLAARTRPYAIVFAVIFPTLLTYTYFVYLADRPSADQQVVYSAGKTLQFVLPFVWVYFLHRKRLAWVGPSRRGLLEGLAFGAAVAAAMLAMYALVLRPGGFLAGADQAVRDKLQDTGLDSTQMFVAAALFYALVHSLLEEYYWRWFVFGELRQTVRIGTAVVISSVGFAAHHVILLGIYLGWQSPLTYLFSLAIAIGGAVWAWIYHRSGTLYGAWLGHLMVDAVIFVIGYDLAREMF